MPVSCVTVVGSAGVAIVAVLEHVGASGTAGSANIFGAGIQVIADGGVQAHAVITIVGGAGVAIVFAGEAVIGGHVVTYTRITKIRSANGVIQIAGCVKQVFRGIARAVCTHIFGAGVSVTRANYRRIYAPCGCIADVFSACVAIVAGDWIVAAASPSTNISSARV